MLHAMLWLLSVGSARKLSPASSSDSFHTAIEGVFNHSLVLPLTLYVQTEESCSSEQWPFLLPIVMTWTNTSGTFTENVTPGGPHLNVILEHDGPIQLEYIRFGYKDDYDSEMQVFKTLKTTLEPAFASSGYGIIPVQRDDFNPMFFFRLSQTVAAPKGKVRGVTIQRKQCHHVSFPHRQRQFNLNLQDLRPDEWEVLRVLLPREAVFSCVKGRAFICNRQGAPLITPLDVKKQCKTMKIPLPLRSPQAGQDTSSEQYVLILSDGAPVNSAWPYLVVNTISYYRRTHASAEWEEIKGQRGKASFITKHTGYVFLQYSYFGLRDRDQMDHNIAYLYHDSFLVDASRQTMHVITVPPYIARNVMSVGEEAPQRPHMSQAMSIGGHACYDAVIRRPTAEFHVSLEDIGAEAHFLTLILMQRPIDYECDDTTWQCVAATSLPWNPDNPGNLCAEITTV